VKIRFVSLDIRNNISTMVEELQRGNRAALPRLLTLALHDGACVSAAIADVKRGSPPVIALTGSGGVGKSSLLGAVAAQFVERGERVGILACDPESPITGGALLGDRCRIAGTSTSDRLFIRSLSTPAGQQGISQNIGLMLDVMKAFGFDRIFIETVGAGQGDVAVRDVVDVVVLVLQPQSGDELQWEKAGILEIADIVVVNKADLPGADLTISEVSQELRSTNNEARIPVLKTSVARSEGIEELCHAIVTVSMSPSRFKTA
jgi:LAO/AO transport system ATPase